MSLVLVEGEIVESGDDRSTLSFDKKLDVRMGEIFPKKPNADDGLGVSDPLPGTSVVAGTGWEKS